LGIIIACLFFTSCQQTDQGHPPYLIDDYLLTPNQKALFNYFSPNSTIQFFDSVNNAIMQLQEVSKTDNDSSVFQSGGDDGEGLSIYYNELTNINPKFNFYCNLIAIPNNDCLIGIEFLSQIKNPYLISDFAFNPFDTNKSDTTYSPPEEVSSFSGNYSYKLSDSITFSSHTFYNVYYLKTPPSDTLVNNCYYSLSEGIVAFQMHSDSTFWIRSN